MIQIALVMIATPGHPKLLKHSWVSDLAGKMHLLQPRLHIYLREVADKIEQLQMLSA